jgi:hypothetical protein
VASVKVMGAAAGEVTHGATPAVALPLAEGSFAKSRSSGQWTLRGQDK